MGDLVLRGGRVIDPATNLDEIADLRIADGVVAEIGSGLGLRGDEAVEDVAGLIVAPGLIDGHVHLRDPGLTYKEDLATGAESALAGGFVRVCCMPNTQPALDTAGRVQDIIDRGRSTGVVIHPIGAITVGRHLEKIGPLEAMAQAGAVGFSDDGESTRSVDAMVEALELSKDLELPIMVHCEDPSLAAGGTMHAGAVSRELGVKGIPALAEESYIERDIALAEQTGGWLHVLHVSTVRGATMIRDAKSRGVRVTAEVMPHHLILTDEWVAGRRRIAGAKAPVNDLSRPDPNAVVNPPLRPESDALGLAEFLHDGTFDYIATDHAPHAVQDKPGDLSRAASGMLGLEFAIPSLAEVVRRCELDWPDVVRLLSWNVAETLRLPGGSLAAGERADVTVIDPSLRWTVTESEIRSRSKNTPLMGMELTGRAVMTVVEGEIRHDVR